MKKKSSVILLSSILAFSTIGATVLSSCGRETNIIEEKFKFTVSNNSEIGDVKITDLSTGEEVCEAKKDQTLLVKVTIKNNDYELKRILANETKLEWNTSYNGFLFVVSEDNIQLKVEYNKLVSKVSIDKETEGIESLEFRVKGEKKPIEFIDNVSKIAVGTEVELKIKLLRDFKITLLQLNGEDIKLNEETNIYSFTVKEQDLDFKVRAQSTAHFRVVLDQGVELSKLVINNKEVLNPTLNKFSEIEVGSKIHAEFKLLDGYVLLNDHSGAFNDNAEAGGYKYDDSIAKLTYKAKNLIEVDVYNAPTGKTAIFMKARVAEKYEFEPFIGTWYAGKGNIDNSVLSYKYVFEVDGTVTLYVTTDATTKHKSTITLKENGIIEAVFQSRTAIYTTFVPVMKDGSITSYIVRMHGFINDLTIINKDENNSDSDIKAYKVKDQSNYIVHIANTNLNLNNWYYFSNQILEKIDVLNASKEPVHSIQNDDEIYIKIKGKEIKSSVLNNEIVAPYYWVGTYTSDTETGVQLDLRQDMTCTYNNLECTYLYDEEKDVVTLQNSTFGEKTFSISTILSKFEVYTPVLNSISGLTYFFRPQENSMGGDENVNQFSDTTFRFIDAEKVWVYQDKQINEAVEYELSENGHLKISFELVTGYRTLEAQFNKDYTKFTFTKGHLIFLGDLDNITASITEFNNVSFDSADPTNETKLVLNKDFSYSLGTEQSTYFIWYNTDETITIKGDHHYKLDLVNGTYETLPDPIDFWFLNSNFYVRVEELDMMSEAPIRKEATINFAGDGKTTSLFEVRHYLFNYGGYDFHYKKENLQYTYDKKTHELIINVEGTKVKLIESEKDQTLKFTSDFGLYGEPYPFKNISVPRKTN